MGRWCPPGFMPWARRPGLVDLDSAGFDLLRIEAGTPAFGREVAEENLPQEIGRDARAISFVKGCYLGQGDGGPDRRGKGTSIKCCEG